MNQPLNNNLSTYKTGSLGLLLMTTNSNEFVHHCAGFNKTANTVTPVKYNKTSALSIGSKVETAEIDFKKK